MTVTLPNDVLNLVALELWQARDFDTLFKFALVNRQLAALALANLYKMQDVAPVRETWEPEVGTNNKPLTAKQRGERIRRWASLWRSILLSTKPGKTVMPYSRYIRTLDLQDLSGLLDEINGRANVKLEWLFGTDLRDLIRTTSSGRARVDVDKTTLSVGEEIIKHAPLLEEIGGDFTKEELPQWLPLVPRLEAIRAFDGRALQPCSDIIQKSCPNLKRLFIYVWRGGESDEEFALFLESLTPRVRLEALQTMFTLQDNSIRSLAYHSTSLKSLRLHSVDSSATIFLHEIGPMPLLKELDIYCISPVESLDPNLPWEEALGNTVKWLMMCPKLESLQLHAFPSCQKVISELTAAQKIPLRHLQLEAFPWSFDMGFGASLRTQETLESLVLRPAYMEQERPEPDFIECLSDLRSLRNLRLGLVSEAFMDRDVGNLVLTLPNLEDFRVMGYLTDETWEYVTPLQHLKVLEFAGWTEFTTAGIRRFIQNRESVTGLDLEILAAKEPLPQEDIMELKGEMIAKGGTKFVFTLWREEESSLDEDD